LVQITSDIGCQELAAQQPYANQLVQSSSENDILRQAMAAIPTNKLDQAIMFELEHVVESAVRAAMPVTADEVIYRVRCIGADSYMHLDSVLDSRCRYFIELPAKQRLKSLPKLLETFDPMYQFLIADGVPTPPGMIQPSDFVEGRRQWPDFKW
jgi:hypothetical protein